MRKEGCWRGPSCSRITTWSRSTSSATTGFGLRSRRRRQAGQAHGPHRPRWLSEAIVDVDHTLNSRGKDFYDVWPLARQFAFHGALLANSIAATFAKRETAIDAAPIAFTAEFAQQPTTLSQWTAFRNKVPHTEAPAKLSEVTAFLAELLLPPARAGESARSGKTGNSFEGHGAPGGAWATRS
jgi:hypothetical protein